MTDDEYAHLALYTEQTYGIDLPYALAKQMEAKGWVDWRPGVFGQRVIWAITESGKQAYERARKNREGT